MGCLDRCRGAPNQNIGVDCALLSCLDGHQIFGAPNPPRALLVHLCANFLVRWGQPECPLVILRAPDWQGQLEVQAKQPHRA